MFKLLNHDLILRRQNLLFDIRDSMKIENNALAYLFKFTLCLPLLIGLYSIAIAAEDPTSEELRSLYNFHPHTLNEKEIDEKSSILDVFWNKAKNNDKKYIELLRAELKKTDHVPFFYFDAGRLLLVLSGTPSDKKLFLQGMRHVNLRDLQTTDYLRIIHKLAVEGFDTSDAALKILQYPKFKAFIPQHFLKLEQDFSLIYMLFPLEDKLFIEKVISALFQEKNEVSQKSLMLVLWYTTTEIGWAALRKVARDKRFSIENKKYAEELLSRIQHASLFSLSSYDSLKKKRRHSLRRISDEALYEFDDYTRDLLSKK